MGGIRMQQIAFVFPGQGGQHIGMDNSLFVHSTAASKVLCKAEECVPALMSEYRDKPDECLQKTANLQPYLYIVEAATTAALCENGIVPTMVAGFSLGELSALTCAATLRFEEGLRLVCKRGQLMQADAERLPTTMVAVLGLDARTVERICSNFKHIYPANYNGPREIVIAGRCDGIAEFRSAVKKAGGRTVMLNVNGGFHSPFMYNAAQGFYEELQGVTLKTPTIDVYANYTGLPYNTDIRELMSKQICSRVLWERSIQNMSLSGAEVFVEVGPGKVLSRLIKSINKNAVCLNVHDIRSLNETVKSLNGTL